LEIDSWLSNFQSRMQEVQQKAAKLTGDLAASSVTKSSADGAVTVNVGANGGLQNLELGRRATELAPAQLSALIMRTVRDAQRAASAKVGEALQDFGDDGAILRQYATFQPPEETPAATRQDRPPSAGFAVPAEPDPVSSAPVPPVPPVPRPAGPPRRPRPRDADDDGDDFAPW
jgi:DNA-binding protein YbaB